MLLFVLVQEVLDLISDYGIGLTGETGLGLSNSSQLLDSSKDTETS